MHPKPEVEIVEATLVEKPAAAPFNPEPETSTNSLFQRLLSPQSLNWMMGSGAGLLVIGFIVWLWSAGVFANPLVGAVCLGAGNLVLLAAGIWLYKNTNFKLAGNGLTLLASLLLPLNLWFYDAQGLIELAEGGPLWIPALAISIIYALVARLTRNPLSAYTLVGGVVLTGLLFLAGPKVALIWALLPTATFLAIVGSLAILADRWFQEEDGAFSRDQFGLAFFRAGHLALMCGLAYLLGGQVLSGSTELIANATGNNLVNGLELLHQKVWAIVLLCGAAGTYFYSHATRRIGAGFWIIGICVLGWAALIGISVFNIPLTFNLICAIAATTVIGVNLWAKTVGTSDSNLSAAHYATMGVTAVGLALVGISQGLFELVDNEIVLNHGMYVAHLILSAAAVWTLPGIWQASDRRTMGQLMVATGAGALAVAIISSLTLILPAVAIGNVVLLALIVPIAILLGATGVPRSELSDRLTLVSFTLTIVCLGFGVAAAVIGLVQVASWTSVAATLMATTIFFFGVWTSGNKSGVALGFASAATTILQLVVLYQLTDAYVLIAMISSLGIASHILGKLWSVREAQPDWKKQPLHPFFHNSANCLVSTAVLGTILFVLSNITTTGIVLGHFGLIAAQFAAIGISYGFTKHEAWKQTLKFLSIALLGTAIIGFTTLSDLSFMERIEVGTLVAGLTTLAAAYIGWSRENEGERSELVTFGFGAGTILSVMPMLLGFVACRFFAGEMPHDFWYYFHEIGTLAVGLVLLGSGVLCRVRATTVGGATLVGAFVIGLISLIQLPAAMNSAAVMMMIGGGVFFTIAIVLSFYMKRQS
jgi:hypothetical protein